MCSITKKSVNFTRGILLLLYNEAKGFFIRLRKIDYLKPVWSYFYELTSEPIAVENVISNTPIE